jgi:hypothetical protein
MDSVYYVIAILGCPDGSSHCTPVATEPTHYSTQAECSTRTQDALLRNNQFDFPTLVAECRATDPRSIASKGEAVAIPANALRG